MKLVLPLDDAAADLAAVGGKGASLARLARAGLPVPAGFHVTTEAYRSFVALFRDAIDPAAPERTKALFAGHDVPAPVAEEIRRAYRALGDDVPVAVRSSATAEDLPTLSFAGQQDTYLNIRGGDAVLDAVRRCWASLWNPRAVAYRDEHGVSHDDVALAVVVQELVPADASGILFTADPVTGTRTETVINAAWGLGEAVVGGQVTPDTVTVTRGVVTRATTGAKTVMTVRTAVGTEERPVPDELRDRPVLDEAQAVELAGLGARIQELFGVPVDVEWTRRDGEFAIVQARPITGLPPQVEEWNDSLKGEYLWTAGNFGEAIPDVMTPITWSFVQLFIHEAMSASAMPGFDMVGNIGGRFYMNLTPVYALAKALRVKSWLGALESVFGRIPPGLDLPKTTVRWETVRRAVPMAIGIRLRVRTYLKSMRAFLAASPQRCEELRGRVAATTTAPALAALYESEIEPHLVTSCHMLEAAGRQGGSSLVKVRTTLRRMVGDVDAEAMLTGVTASHELASLGLLTGLTRLARGEITRDEFARRYGHRGPHEFELSIPRPGEDPGWIDAQLAGLRDLRTDTTRCSRVRRRPGTQAWARFAARYPGQTARMRERVRRWGAVVRDRETARSENIRAFWVLRAFVVRAGELTGVGDDVFFLHRDELLDLLRGDKSALDEVPVRRATYEQYAALPPYPALIVGHFDPVRWAADPGRRSDLYDARGGTVPASDTVAGFPGAPGVVEGIARVIPGPEQGDRLQPGDVLVTTVTNVGWTPLFPRAAAVVTDLGAPLSHASIVARELGIPAVVGTGNATMRLHDGDRVRVDGERGTVEVLT